MTTHSHHLKATMSTSPKTLLPLIFIVSLVTFCFGTEQNSGFRFLKLFLRYDTPTYTALDRDVFGSADYNANYSENNLSMFEQKYNASYNGNVGCKITSVKSDRVFVNRTEVDGKVFGTIGKRSDIAKSQELSVGDSSLAHELKAECSGLLKHSFKWYPVRDRFRPFVGCDIAIDGYYTKSKSQNYRHEIYTRNTRSKSTIHSGMMRSTGILTPAVGIGKPQPVTPMYRAFEIERKLKRNGTIAGNLTSETLLLLSQFCGKLPSFRINHDRPEKFVMQELQSILLKDDAIDSVLLDAYALFMVYETFSESVPSVYCGYQFKLRGSFGGMYSRQYKNGEAEKKTTTLNYMFKEPLQASYTMPVSSRFFIEMQSDVSSSAKVLDLVGAEGAISGYYLLTNSFWLVASLSHISTRYMVPSEWPQSYTLTAMIFIEDQMHIEMSAFHNLHREDDKRASSKDQGMNVRLNYDW